MNCKSECSQMLLLLTGCINPRGMIYTKLADPHIRKQHYIDAIRFYLEKTKLPILFVENSGTDISSYFSKEINSGRVEVLTCDNNRQAQSFGKGFGEMLIIKHAINYSCFFKKAEFVFKITGRYQIINFGCFLKQVITKNVDVLCHVNDTSFIDSRIFGATPCFFTDVLIHFHENINDKKNFYFEHALYAAAKMAEKIGYDVAFFSRRPRYSVITGTDNVKINDSYFIWCVRNIKYQFQRYIVNRNGFVFKNVLK